MLGHAVKSTTCALLSILFLATPIAAAEPERGLKCVACHLGKNRLVLDSKSLESVSVTINFDDFRSADHGKLECGDCHVKGFSGFPHRNKQSKTCMDCHPREGPGAEKDKPYEFDRIRREFEDTIHFKKFKHGKPRCCGTATVASAGGAAPPASEGTGGAGKVVQRFACEHCHEPHYFKATSRLKEPALIRYNDNGFCLRCHSDDAKGPLADPAEPSLLAAHHYLPHVKIHLESSRCVDCHTNVKLAVAHDLPEGNKANQGCNTCHSIDSILMTRLYRYVSAEGSGPTLGFNNSRLLLDNYVIGANRHIWTDVAAYLLTTLGLVLVLAHGSWRIVDRWRRGEARGRRSRVST